MKFLFFSSNILVCCCWIRVTLWIIFKQKTLYNKDWRTSRSSGGKQDYAKEKQIQSLNISWQKAYKTNIWIVGCLVISISIWDNLRQIGGHCITWPGKFCLSFVTHHHSSNSLGTNHIRANQKRYLEGKQGPIYNKGIAGLGWQD